jgi:N-methylhydantoinase B/oxoprolinase/acetone carboxylase alpha subunit
MKGIGREGKHLKELLEESEQKYQESGHFFGLKNLKLATENPMKLELLHTRLRAAMVGGREQVRQISASPLVREVAELAVALYTPEGYCIIQSTGIIIHMDLMGELIKWMVKHDYETDEQIGIREGDVFTSNDNRIVGMHSADFYDVIPIFWKGELIGWVGTVIMETELGGICPGNVPTLATERFVEGIRFGAEKTGENDHWHRFSEQRIRNSCRLPDLLILDRKAALGADIKVREDIKTIVEEFGVDYYRDALRELIEMERRSQLERVKRRTVPGRLRSLGILESYYSDAAVPPHHRKDHVAIVPFDFTIKGDGSYYWDFDGAGKWGWHPNNTTPLCMKGAICLYLTQTISYTGHANSGTFACVQWNCPDDTVVNPSNLNVATGGFFSGPIILGSVAVGLQSRAFFSRGFVEEVITAAPVMMPWAVAGSGWEGEDFGQIQNECAGSMPSGGLAIRDGFLGYIIWLPVADMGNAEIWETHIPLITMGRRFIPDSCGWGQFRSGHALSTTHMVATSPCVIDLLACSTNDKFYIDTGMFGGYPGVNQFAKFMVKSNTLELIENQKPLVHGITPENDEIRENLTGSIEIETSGSRFFNGVGKKGDILQVGYGGNAGGFGDPIKRDPVNIKKDLDTGLLSLQRCRSIFCAEASYDDNAEEWIMNVDKTIEMREKRKKERMAKGIPVNEWWQNRRQDILKEKMPQLLKNTYNGSLEKGNRWPTEFRMFWNLPSDFYFQVEED